jgi:hypothetical protein
MKKEISFLLPRGFKPLGLIFTAIGIALSYIRFHYGYKPDLLERKVFAFYSLYLESKILQIIKNQLLEEIAGVFLIIGLFLIAFSKEKKENSGLNGIRLNAFFITAYSNLFFIVLSLLFTFGLGFVYMLIVNMVLWLVIYIITFRILLISNTKKVDSLTLKLLDDE